MPREAPEPDASTTAPAPILSRLRQSGALPWLLLSAACVAVLVLLTLQQHHRAVTLPALAASGRTRSLTVPSAVFWYGIPEAVALESTSRRTCDVLRYDECHVHIAGDGTSWVSRR